MNTRSRNFLPDDAYVRADGLHSKLDDSLARIKKQLLAQWDAHDYSAAATLIARHLKDNPDPDPDVQSLRDRLPVVRWIKAADQALHASIRSANDHHYKEALNTLTSVPAEPPANAPIHETDRPFVAKLKHRLIAQRTILIDAWLRHAKRSVDIACEQIRPDLATAAQVIASCKQIPLPPDDLHALLSALDEALNRARHRYEKHLRSLVAKHLDARNPQALLTALSDYRSCFGELPSDLQCAEDRLSALKLIASLKDIESKVLSLVSNQRWAAALTLLSKVEPPNVTVSPDDKTASDDAYRAIRAARDALSQAWLQAFCREIQSLCTGHDESLTAAAARLEVMAQTPFAQESDWLREREALSSLLLNCRVQSRRDAFARAQLAGRWEDALRIATEWKMLSPSPQEPSAAIALANHALTVSSILQSAIESLQEGKFSASLRLTERAISSQSEAFRCCLSDFEGTAAEFRARVLQRRNAFVACVNDLRPALAAANWAAVSSLLATAVQMSPGSRLVRSIEKQAHQAQTRHRRRRRALVAWAASFAILTSLAITISVLRRQVLLDVRNGNTRRATRIATIISPLDPSARAFRDAMKAEGLASSLVVSAGDILTITDTSHWSAALRAIEDGRHAMHDGKWDSATTAFSQASATVSNLVALSGVVTVRTLPSDAQAEITVSWPHELSPRSMTLSAGPVAPFRALRGQYTFAISHSNYIPWSTTVTVTPGATPIVLAKARLRPGSFVISSDILSEIWEPGGGFVATTEEIVRPVPAGRHTYLIKCPEYETLTVSFTVPPGGAVSNHVTMVRVPGTVALMLARPDYWTDAFGLPHSALIRLGTNDPVTVTNFPYTATLLPGSYALTCQAAGFLFPAVSNITVRSAVTSSVMLETVPLPFSIRFLETNGRPLTILIDTPSAVVNSNIVFVANPFSPRFSVVLSSPGCRDVRGKITPEPQTAPMWFLVTMLPLSGSIRVIPSLPAACVAPQQPQPSILVRFGTNEVAHTIPWGGGLLEDIPAGVYNVSASASGFVSSVASGVRVTDRATTNAYITLHPQVATVTFVHPRYKTSISVYMDSRPVGVVGRPMNLPALIPLTLTLRVPTRRGLFSSYEEFSFRLPPLSPAEQVGSIDLSLIKMARLNR